MEVVCITLMDDKFMKGFSGVMKSLLKYNPGFNYPLYVLDNGLSEDSKVILRDTYQNITCKPIHKDVYIIDKTTTTESLVATYYKLEMFRRDLYPKDTERVLFLDMDLLILKDISGLISFCLEGKPLGACRQYNVTQDILRNDINSGVLLLDLEALPLNAYETMVEMAKHGSFLPDQIIINDYFLHNNKLCTYLPKTYNVEKRMCLSISMKDTYDAASIIHYVGTKPWEEASFGELDLGTAYSLWHNLFGVSAAQLPSTTIVLEDDLVYSYEELKDFIQLASVVHGRLVFAVMSYQLSSNCGRLISLLKRKPDQNRDGTWYFSFDIGVLPANQYITPVEDNVYFKYLLGKSVIFVGPSPILLGQGMGTFIDSFDVVVRTNNMLNALIENPGLAKDYGSKTDILYVNVTYERDMQNIWDVDAWYKAGLKFISKSMHRTDGVSLPFFWRNTPSRLSAVSKPTLFLGTQAIFDLLSYQIKKLYLTGVDGYANIPEETTEKYDEYIPGYLPEFVKEQRLSRLGTPVALHDKYRDTKLILSWESDPRFEIDPLCKEQMETVANGPSNKHTKSEDGKSRP